MKKFFCFLIMAALIGACVYGWSRNAGRLPEKLLKWYQSSFGRLSPRAPRETIKKPAPFRKHTKPTRESSRSVPAQTVDRQEPVPAVTLAAVGDVDMHMPIVNSALNPSDQTYDFRPIFSEIRPELQSADFATGVLETQLGEPGEKYTGYPEFRSPQALADALKWAGLKLVFTAHNHSLDQGAEGLIKTLRYLEKIDLPYAGCRYQEKGKSYRIVDCKGIRLGFLSYTSFTNDHPLPSGREWMVNMMDRQKALQEIQEVKEGGADCIIAAVHTGVEYQRKPSKEQRELCDWLIRSGVDIVLGSHVHVVQPLEKRSYYDPVRMAERDGFVAYSLGNLLSNQRWRYSDYGLMVKFLLTKKKEGPGVGITLTEYMPLWVNRYLEHGKYLYRIIKVTGSECRGNDPTVDEAARRRMGEVFTETRELMNPWTQAKPPELPDPFSSAGVKGF